jgi:hypothetical protein
MTKKKVLEEQTVVAPSYVLTTRSGPFFHREPATTDLAHLEHLVAFSGFSAWIIHELRGNDVTILKSYEWQE